jgi:mannose-6-phosphate isomerase-like protein (cupin superfamily)
MHSVSKIDPAAARTPRAYEKRSAGFRRISYADRHAGSVHMGASICFLEPQGVIQPHLHAFEESFYLLAGSLVVQVAEQAFAVRPGNFGLIGTGVRHGWRNAGDVPACWLEMQAPQPRGQEAQAGRDTFFVGGDVSAAPISPLAANPLLGYFDEALLPRPGGPSEMEGFNPLAGVAIKMFVDRSFGAIHQSLFLIQYQPGAKIDPHDHTFEESYYIVRGRVQATADGRTYDLGPGDVIWTGVGCVHSFANVGDEPVCWIETQAPLPPAKEVFRFERDWLPYAAEETA